MIETKYFVFCPYFFQESRDEKLEAKGGELESASPMGRRPSFRSLQERRRKSMTSEDLAMLQGMQQMLHNTVRI